MESTTVNPVRLLGEFVAAEFPGCVGLLLFGSHATGRATAESDVDACVLLPRMERSSQQRRDFCGTHLDLHIYDFAALMQTMRRQQGNRLAHVATWLRQGVVLKDDAGFLRRAIESATEILDGPKEPVDWSTHRTSIANLLRHARTANDEHARLSCLNALYRLTTNVILLRAGRWLQSPTELARELHDVDAALCVRLHETYREAIAGAHAAFLALVDHELHAIDTAAGGAKQRLVA